MNAAATATVTATAMKRQEIANRHAILEAIRGISAIEELVEYEPGHGYKFGVDLEVAIYGRNYGPGKKVGPYIRMYDYPPGLEIVRQGDWDTNTFFIVVAGAVEVFVAGVAEPVAVFEPGKPFGEMGVLAGMPRSATVIAHRQRGARVLEVQRPALRVLRKLRKFGAALDITYRNNGRAAVANQLQIPDELRKSRRNCGFSVGCPGPCPGQCRRSHPQAAAHPGWLGQTHWTGTERRSHGLPGAGLHPWFQCSDRP